MGFHLVFLFIYIALQKNVWAQQNIINEMESKANAIVQQAKSQVLILANQLVTNVSLVTRSAEGNASLLLANLYNSINKGIAEAQMTAIQIGNALQANFSKQSDEFMEKAAATYTKVQAELRNSTTRIEEAIQLMVTNSEVEIKKAMKNAKSVNSSPPAMLNTSKTTIDVKMSTENPKLSTS